MTVFRPSLPPLSCTTTRTLPVASGPAAAARAERARKPGTSRPSDNSVEEPNAVLRNERRDRDMATSLGEKRARLGRRCCPVVPQPGGWGFKITAGGADRGQSGHSAVPEASAPPLKKGSR